MEKIFKDFFDFTVVNDRLRRNALDYPAVYKEMTEDTYGLAAWVPFSYNGKIYKRICIESAIISPNYSKERLEDRFEHLAQQVIQLAVPCYLDIEIPQP